MLLSDLKKCFRNNALEKVRQYPRYKSYVLFHFEIVYTPVVLLVRYSRYWCDY
jgi:hypothetical protein